MAYSFLFKVRCCCNPEVSASWIREALAFELSPKRGNYSVSMEPKGPLNEPKPTTTAWTVIPWSKITRK